MQTGNRSYEIMFIVRPDVEEAELDKILETFTGYVTAGGGTIRSTEKMGRRRLAYTVRKFNDGFYLLILAEAPAAAIAEIERRLRVSEQVIKFITVRMDEEEKRLAKIKKHRDAHVKRSAQPQVNAEAAAEVPAAAPAAEAPVAQAPAAGAEAPVAEAAVAEAPAEETAAAQA